MGADSELLRQWERVFQDKPGWAEGQDVLSDEEEWCAMLDSYLRLDDEFGGDYLDYLDTETLESVPLEERALVNEKAFELFKRQLSSFDRMSSLDAFDFKRELSIVDDPESAGYFIPPNSEYVSDEEEKRRERQEILRCREEMFDGGNMKSCSLVTATDGVSPRWDALAASLDTCLPLRVSKPTHQSTNHSITKATNNSATEARKTETRKAETRKTETRKTETRKTETRKRGRTTNTASPAKYKSSHKLESWPAKARTRKSLGDRPVPNYMKSTRACENKRRPRQEEENDILSSPWTDAAAH